MYWKICNAVEAIPAKKLLVWNLMAEQKHTHTVLETTEMKVLRRIAGKTLFDKERRTCEDNKRWKTSTYGLTKGNKNGDNTLAGWRTREYLRQNCPKKVTCRKMKCWTPTNGWSDNLEAHD